MKQKEYMALLVLMRHEELKDMVPSVGRGRAFLDCKLCQHVHANGGVLNR